MVSYAIALDDRSVAKNRAAMDGAVAGQKPGYAGAFPMLRAFSPQHARPDSGGTDSNICAKTPNLFAIHLPFLAKRPAISPHRHPRSPKTPISDTPGPADMSPLLQPLPRPIPYYPTRRFQPATQGGEG